jgi:5-methylthioadenosine/S-adenosylhomocysteine deaminase
MLAKAADFLARHHDTGDRLVQGIVTVDEFHCAPGRLLPEAHALARRAGVRLTLHFAEQLMEFVEVMKEHGLTPVQRLAELGVLDDRVLLAHALFLAGHHMVSYPHGGDLELLGQAGASVAHSPLAFARRGLALEHFDRYRAAGIHLALGTDVYPMDLFAEMRMASIACKFQRNDHEAAPALSVFEAATLGGAHALGRDDLGRLAVGAKADIVVLDVENLQFGPVYDPIRAIVHLATPAQVERVIVDGSTRVEGGRLVGHDEREIARAAARSARRVWDGFDGYHWRGQPVHEVFPPSLEPWDGSPA